MKPSGYLLAVAVLLATASPHARDAEGTFERKLAKDKQAVHVLNRLAFGPRPGQADEVRRLGVENWIRGQLDPRRLPESAALEARLQPNATLQLASWQILDGYQNAPGTAGALRVLQPNGAITVVQVQNTPGMAELRQKVTAASLDDRRRILLSLPPEVRRQLFVGMPANLLQGLPDLQLDAADARQANTQARVVTMVRSSLAQLLSQDQLQVMQRGTDAEKTALLKGLDEQKRVDVLRATPTQNVPAVFRREYLRIAQPQQLVTAELIEGKLLRAVYSTRQLEEVLVDFWLNHFNVFVGKDRVRFLLTSYERDAIRPHVLGRFGDMLRATARHPAMLFYLDNWQSQVASEDTSATTALLAGTRGRGLNENYGRELLELHTLGVDGGYTQNDVIAVARAFTGWTIHEPNRYGEFYFNPAMHDRGEKVVLGHTLPAGSAGEQDGLRVLEILERHPSTARFISRKLAQRFVADEPPPALVTRMADTFTRTGGDLRAVMETLLFSREFMSEGAWRAKVKSPLEIVVSALRALDADVADTTALAQRIAELGQPLYGKQEPTGYPNTSEVWTSSAGLLARMSFAQALSSGAIPGVTANLAPFDRLDGRQAALRLLGTAPSDRLTAAIGQSSGERSSVAVLASVLVASPDFQKR